jgi:hypothetical protein
MPKVFHTAGGPGIRPFTHRRCWSNRINRYDLIERVGNPRHRFVCIKRLVAGSFFVN